MTEVQTPPTICRICNHATERRHRGWWCKECEYQWVDGVPVPMKWEEAETLRVGANLLSKLIATGKVNDSVNMGLAQKGIAGSDTNYFRPALDRLTKLGLLQWPNSDTFGVNKEKVEDARAFVVRYADEKRVARIQGFGSGESVVAEEPEPPAQAPPAVEGVTRAELDAALRLLRRDMSMSGSTGNVGVDQDLRLNGIEHRIKSLEDGLASLKAKDYLTTNELDRFEKDFKHAVEHIVGTFKEQVVHNRALLKGIEGLQVTIAKEGGPAPQVQVAPEERCNSPYCPEGRAEKVMAKARDPATNEWTRDTVTVGSCKKHLGNYWVVVGGSDEPHLRTLASRMKRSDTVLLVNESRSLDAALQRHGIGRKAAQVLQASNRLLDHLMVPRGEKA